MAGSTVLMSPVSMLMIHNPATIAMGDSAEMQKAIEMLASVKDSIINAYALKTGLSRAKLSHLMDAETWMDANKAVELGFADDIMIRAAAAPVPDEDEDEEDGVEEDDTDENGQPNEQEKKKKAESMLFSRRTAQAKLMNKLQKHVQVAHEEKPVHTNERSVKDIMARLDDIKKFM
jgi:ATP-dependent Clp protease protease subunit